MDSVSLLLADARLPTGGHAQSGGLEPALLAGLRPDEIEGLLRTRLRTNVPVDAGTAVVVVLVITLVNGVLVRGFLAGANRVFAAVRRFTAITRKTSSSGGRITVVSTFVDER